MRKTKIICTLGPSTDNDEVLRELMLSGMDAARFNFSHSDHPQHKIRLEKFIALRDLLNLPIATILDTKGPEIRLRKFKNDKATLVDGQFFTLTTNEIEGDENIASISYINLPKDINIGTVILIDDGLLELNVQSFDDTNIICKVIHGGPVSNNKGVNVPGIKFSMPYISEKDKSDIIFGIENGFDCIAASFTRTSADILQIREILDQHNCHTIKIIAKIENAEGVSNIDDIIRVSDGIMIARGDMGVEIPMEEIPIIQKVLIRKAYNAGKIVITATQMLESMIKNTRPTRAEATDVANAIYDGTSCVMLSGETAAGLYPIETVRTMAKIARRTEQDIDYKKRFNTRDINESSNVTNAISHATCTTAYDLGAKAIITVTKSGTTARMISKYRSSFPIIGCTTYPHIYRQLNMSWGVVPLLVDEKDNTDELFDHAIDVAQKAGYVDSGDLVVITAGIPLGISGTTNLLKVHIVGDVLVSGMGVTNKALCGNLCVCTDETQALRDFRDGDILVIPFTSNKILNLLKRASGIVTEQEGLNSHAAIVGLTLDIPVIVGAENATQILKSGTNVSIDATRGIICNSGINKTLKNK